MLICGVVLQSFSGQTQTSILSC